MHAVVDHELHRVDRDGDLLLVPQVPFVEEDVGHLVLARPGDEPADLPDGPVRGVDVLTAPDLSSAHGDLALGDAFAPWAEPHPEIHTRPEDARHCVLLGPLGLLVEARPGPDARLFGLTERVELCLRAVERDGIRDGRVDEIDRHDARAALAQLGSHHEGG